MYSSMGLLFVAFTAGRCIPDESNSLCVESSARGSPPKCLWSFGQIHENWLSAAFEQRRKSIEGKGQQGIYQCTNSFLVPLRRYTSGLNTDTSACHRVSRTIQISQRHLWLGDLSANCYTQLKDPNQWPLNCLLATSLPTEIGGDFNYKGFVKRVYFPSKAFLLATIPSHFNVPNF